jgi:hypothetical protein
VISEDGVPLEQYLFHLLFNSPLAPATIKLIITKTTNTPKPSFPVCEIELFWKTRFEISTISSTQFALNPKKSAWERMSSPSYAVER